MKWYKKPTLLLFDERKIKTNIDVTNPENFWTFFRETYQKYNGVPTNDEIRKWMKLMRRPIY